MGIGSNVRAETPEEKKLKKTIGKENHETREEKKQRKKMEKKVIH